MQKKYECEKYIETGISKALQNITIPTGLIFGTKISTSDPKDQMKLTISINDGGDICRQYPITYSSVVKLMKYLQNESLFTKKYS